LYLDGAKAFLTEALSSTPVSSETSTATPAKTPPALAKLKEYSARASAEAKAAGAGSNWEFDAPIIASVTKAIENLAAARTASDIKAIETLIGLFDGYSAEFVDMARSALAEAKTSANISLAPFPLSSPGSLDMASLRTRLRVSGRGENGPQMSEMA